MGFKVFAKNSSRITLCQQILSFIPRKTNPFQVETAGMSEGSEMGVMGYKGGWEREDRRDAEGGKGRGGGLLGGVSVRSVSMLPIVFVLLETPTLILETTSFDKRSQRNVHLSACLFKKKKIVALYQVLKCVCRSNHKLEATQIPHISCKPPPSKPMTQQFWFHVHTFEKMSYLMFNFPKLCCSFYESHRHTHTHTLPFLYLPHIYPLVLPLSHSLYCLRRRGDI